MKKGTEVVVNIGHRILFGKVTEFNEGSKYISVKHDNFASEVFNLDQVTDIEGFL